MSSLHIDLVSAASRRAMVTGGQFTFAMKREAAVLTRRVRAGQIASFGSIHDLGLPSLPGQPGADTRIPSLPVGEAPLSEPGAQMPEVPTPDADHPGPTEPTAEAASKPKKPRAKSNPPASTGPTTAAGDGSVETSSETGAVPGDPMPIPGSEPVVTTDPELVKRQKNVGKVVEWSAFGATHIGTIKGVVPAGKVPADIGFEAGGKAKARDHISYVVEKETGALVWPAVKDAKGTAILTFKK